MEVERIRAQFTETFEGNPWYGENILSIVNKVTDARAFNNGITGKHSIIEIINHLINWCLYIISRFDFQRDLVYFENNNWKTIVSVDLIEWEKTIGALQMTQEKLMMLLNMIDDSFLNKVVPEKSYTFRTLLYGSIQHDIYHIGQVSYCI